MVPLQFWTAPLLSPSLGLDTRVVLLERTSPKLFYAGMIPICTWLLHAIAGLQATDIFATLLSGFGCGCVHHLALFVFGMRGYTSATVLALTLFTEWPALIIGLAVFRHLGHIIVEGVAPKALTKSLRGNTLFNLICGVALVSIIGPRLAAVQEEDAVASLIPIMPGKHMQSVGTAYLRLRTCIAPAFGLTDESKQLECWHQDQKHRRADVANDAESYVSRYVSHSSNNGTDMLVLASAAKAGAVLSARIAAEVGSACGYCVASGERTRAGIPGPVETLPVYDGRLLLAITNMQTWPDYVVAQGFPDPRIKQPQSTGTKGTVRCVSMLREPLDRLRSLYLYARSGGEAWFRYESGLMRRLQETGSTANGGNLESSIQVSVWFVMIARKVSRLLLFFVIID